MDNNIKLMMLALVTVSFVGGIFVGFALDNGDSGNDSDTRTVIDARGRNVEVPMEIDSILAIKSCSLELVSFFEAVNKVSYLDVNERFNANRTHSFMMKELLEDLPQLDPENAEAIFASDVDVIISSTTDPSRLDDESSKYGKPVFAINADLEFDDAMFFVQISLLGDLFNEKERANELTDGIKAIISEVSLKSITGAINGYSAGIMFYGAGEFMKSTGDFLPFKYIGVNNIIPTNPAGNRQPYVVSSEVVLKGDMDYIFLDGSNLQVTIAGNNSLLSNYSIMQNKDAVKEGNIYKVLTYKDWGTNWQNVLINICYVASIVIGEDTMGWSFEDKADEVLDLFYPNVEKGYADLAASQSGNGCGKVNLDDYR